MNDKIKRYLNYMIEKYNITGAMITGSYVTKEMGPKSDIDIFFIWDEEEKSMRGREYFENQEFEYFISPEWKYYDRLEKDTISMRIYSNAKIIYDKDQRLTSIKDKAIEKVESYQISLTKEQKEDYAFWLDTIKTDGEDLYDKDDKPNFLFFTGSQLTKMTNLLCKLHSRLPVYDKYGVKEINEIDSTYADLLEQFLYTSNEDQNKKNVWMELCTYLEKTLGYPDIREYKRMQNL